ncbi:acetyl esterase/lipase [Nocardioides sp. J9]|uniref:alpha/beta hydrolase fold domain-containing protein n=1 Tax=Nocardioides sp. J9 TaxID=935844 RepID=UPI0011ABAF2F|nr:alpha/beta hydrolase fold domain-containing protein [Nocardioides sp. J9]TWH03181.1 acetyl esterase/lipase [Nocardioides sp. J9]
MHLPLPAARLVVRRLPPPGPRPPGPPARQRQVINALMRVAILPKGTRTEAAHLAGVPAERISPPGSRPDRVLLYLHGGAYLIGSPTTHRAAAAHLADAAGAVAYVLDYRLAPENPYPAAVEDALAAYQGLLESGFSAEHVVVAGDSAGGGLALALALRLREVGIPAPAALGLISPWVDLSLAGLDTTVDDPLLSRGWLELGAASYAPGGTDLPEVSPLRADLAGLPPLFVQAASDEMFRFDVERFVDAARAAGVDVTYALLEGHWHVSHLFAGMVSEATDVVRQLGGWLRGALG